MEEEGGTGESRCKWPSQAPVWRSFWILHAAQEMGELPGCGELLAGQTGLQLACLRQGRAGHSRFWPQTKCERMSGELESKQTRKLAELSCKVNSLQCKV